jgi:EAL domain-containing protein (putative c-di-GMP-specific phosphodiesterase class I)/uncharacterized protein YsxB (DUF464 family)
MDIQTKDALFDLKSLNFEKGLDSYTVNSVFQKRKNIKTDTIIGVEVFGHLKDSKGRTYQSQLVISELISHELLDKYKLALLDATLEKCRSIELDNDSFEILFNLNIHVLSNQEFIDALKKLQDELDSHIKLILDFDSTQLTNLAIEQTHLIQSLKEMGFYLSVEVADLNVNLESILEMYPISDVKFSQNIVSEIEQSHERQRKLAELISVSNKYSASTTAVGVSTKAAFTFLNEKGIDFIQSSNFGELESEDDTVSKIIDSLNQDTLATTGSKKIICFTGKVKSRKSLLHLLEPIADIDFYELDPAVTESITIDHHSIILFDLNNDDDISSAKQLIETLNQDIVSIAMLPKLADPNTQFELMDIGTYEIIEKPVAPIELVTKIERSFAFLTKFHSVVTELEQVKASLNQQQKNATNEELINELEETRLTAFRSMQDASSYGELVRFVKLLSTAQSEKALVSTFFNYMDGQNLKASIYLKNGHSEHAYSGAGIVCPPIEFNVFELLRSTSRLHEFGNRLMVNDKNVSFLIKNMPEDEDLRGRLRDYVAVAIECLQEKQVSLMQSETILSAAENLTNVTNDAIELLNNSREIRKKITEEVCGAISKSFESLDLSLEQEDALTSVVAETLAESEQGEDGIDHIIERINSVITNLANVVNKEESEQSEIDSQQVEDDDDGSIVLF